MSTTPPETSDSRQVTDAVAEATIYRVLGTIYLEPPDEALLADLARWADRWLRMDPPAPVADALEPIAGAKPHDAEGLNEEFTRLFRGVVPHSPEPPYESLYRDGALYGPSAGAVREAYRAAGVDVDAQTGELADHLGIELHVVAELRERDDVESLREFVREHPLAWFDDFAATVEEADPVAFYRGALELTRHTLETWGCD